MNKQELIAHFQEKKSIIEKEIAFWQAQPDDAPEPPKLGHGDFGVLDDYGAYMAIRCASDFKVKRGEILLASSSGLTPTLANGKIYIDQWHFFGNIFALLKEWSEADSSKWESKKGSAGESIVLEADNEKIWLGTCGSSDHYTLEIAEEIWRKLGGKIATLKRKQKWVKSIPASNTYFLKRLMKKLNE